MKFLLLIALCALTAFPTYLRADSTEVSDSTSISEYFKHNYFDYFWDSTDKDLRLNIALEEGLVFPKTYSVSTQVTDTGSQQICRFVCTTDPNSVVVSSEGLLLKELEFIVTVEPDAGTNSVDYTITTNSIYDTQAPPEELMVEATISGWVEDAQIDLEQNARFGSYTDTPRDGVISFTLIPSDDHLEIIP
jgi:hypothetical protein